MLYQDTCFKEELKLSCLDFKEFHCIIYIVTILTQYVPTQNVVNAEDTKERSKCGDFQKRTVSRWGLRGTKEKKSGGRKKWRMSHQ